MNIVTIVYYEKYWWRMFMDEIELQQNIVLTDKDGKEIKIMSFEPEKIELWV